MYTCKNHSNGERLTLSILLGVFCIFSLCSSICVSKSSMAALKVVTSSFSVYKKKGGGWG